MHLSQYSLQYNGKSVEYLGYLRIGITGTLCTACRQILFILFGKIIPGLYCLFLRSNACLRFVKVKRRSIFVSCTCVIISTARTLKQPVRLVAVTACIACLFLWSGSNICLRFVKVKRRNVFVSCACVIISATRTLKQPVRLAVCGIPLCTALLYRCLLYTSDAADE